MRLQVKRIKYVHNPSQTSAPNVVASNTVSPTLKPTSMKALPRLPSLNSLSKFVGLSQDVQVQSAVVSPPQATGVSTPIRPPSAMRRRSSLVSAEERMKERERVREREKEHQQQDPVSRLKLLVVS